MDTKSKKLRDACELAAQTFRKMNRSEYHDIVSNLEFCIGSYDFDKNPAGLKDYGNKALIMLKAIKKKQPNKISKEIIASLEGSLT